VASGPPNGEADLWPPLPDFLNRNRPALGPVGDTLDDLEPPFGAFALIDE